VASPTAAFLSFRLGAHDGVSIEARKWEWALRELGFATRRIAGAFGDTLRPDDTWLPFLDIEPPRRAPVELDALAAALAGTDLIVVENLCSLPLNLTASGGTAAVLAEHRGRVAFHHHDLASERAHLAHLTEFPPDRPDSLHVTINDRARQTLAARGVVATTIRNAFDLDPRPGDRDATRRVFGFTHHDLVVLQPSRAIPRKEVGRGLEFAEDLGRLVPGRPLRYWLTGPAQDGYGPTLDALIERTSVSVTRGWAASAQDAYAASDVVVFPSSLEGFGNPVIEALVADRPVAAARYPVLDELLGLGLRVFTVEEPAAVAEWLDRPDLGIRAANRACLEQHFDLRDLPHRIAEAFSTVRWDHW
jgi:glycosyltransferase involved in cell wall biosynthesis